MLIAFLGVFRVVREGKYSKNSILVNWNKNESIIIFSFDCFCWKWILDSWTLYLLQVIYLFVNELFDVLIWCICLQNNSNFILDSFQYSDSSPKGTATVWEKGAGGVRNLAFGMLRMPWKLAKKLSSSLRRHYGDNHKVGQQTHKIHYFFPY